MSREVQVRFCERRGVRFPPPTHRILGFCGPRREAEEIKERVRTFLRDHLKLELSEPKTLITHGRTQSARFLGYDIPVLAHDPKNAKRGHRAINGRIRPPVQLEGSR